MWRLVDKLDMVYQWEGQGWEIWRVKTFNWRSQKYELVHIKEVGGVKLNKAKM